MVVISVVYPSMIFSYLATSDLRLVISFSTVLMVLWMVVISVVYPSMIFSYLVTSDLRLVISFSTVFFSSLTFSSLSVRVSILVLIYLSSEVAVVLRDFFSLSFLVHLVVSSSYLIFLPLYSCSVLF